MRKEEVTVRPTKEGVLVVLDDLQDFGTLKHMLRTHLNKDSLSAGTQVVLDLGRRQVSAKDKKSLEKIIRQAGMVLKRLNFISEPPRVAQADLKQETKQRGPSNILPIMLDVSQQIAAASDSEHKEMAENSTENLEPPWELFLPDEGETLLVMKTLRSGNKISFDGNVVIVGDVNPGAEVVAGGHIVVMGYFRGMAHAGCHGNEQALVTAFRLQPTQLRIANHITRCPDGKYLAPDAPEAARIKEGLVIIEAYQANPDKQMKIS